MPTAEQHLTKYRVNKRLLETDEMSIEKNSKHYEWIITVAFYSALHLIEREMDMNDEIPCNGTTDHKSRNEVIAKTARFRNIRAQYKCLADACWKARYEAGRMNKNDAQTAINNLSKIEEYLLNEIKQKD